MKYSKTPILFAIATATLLLYGCFLGPEREQCTGRLILENAIPDTTVAVGDTLFIDLANPPVFVSSEGEVTYLFQALTNGTNIDLNRMENANDDGKFTLLIVIGLARGETRAEVTGKDGCLENSTTFDITITEQ